MMRQRVYKADLPGPTKYKFYEGDPALAPPSAPATNVTKGILNRKRKQIEAKVTLVT